MAMLILLTDRFCHHLWLKWKSPNTKPVVLSTMQVGVETVGNIATNTYELSFYNPNNRILSGKLKFGLLDGVSVIDYALDIKGKYRYSSIVPKAKATEAYENTIRQKIDPALLEKTVGNNFKVHLYPIPKKGYKKIKIITQELLKSKKNNFIYQIPFSTAKRLKKLSVSIKVANLDKKPAVNKAIRGIKVDKSSTGFYINFEKTNYRLDQPFYVNIPVENKDKIYIQKGESANYFLVQTKLKQKIKNRKLPTKIAILWNNSFSNKDRDFKKEMEFLKEYTKKIKSIGIVEFFTFSNKKAKQEKYRFCPNNTSDYDKKASMCFIQYNSKKLLSMRYDGTTDFSHIDISRIDADEILLFSNGVKTIFDGDMQNIDKPITVINSSKNADYNTLKKYAKISNGRFIDLSRQTAKEGFENFQQQKIKISFKNSSSNLTDIFNSNLSKDNIFIVGKFDNSDSKLMADFNMPGKKFTKTYDLKNAVKVENIDRIWASKKIDDLKLHNKTNKDQILKLAQKHKILIKEASMIVLDRVEDYVEYEIPPPADLMAKYKKLLKQKIDKKLYEKEQAMVESIKAMQQQKAWYNKTYPKTKPKPTKNKSKRYNKSRGSASSGLMNPNVELKSVNEELDDISDEFNEPASQANKAPKIIIKLKSFNPNSPYMDKIKSKKKTNWLQAYYQQKLKYLKQPMFYVDVADLFYNNKTTKNKAVQILLNVVELDFDNPEYLRIVGFKLMEFEKYHLAVRMFEKIKELRPFEPQSFRDLALAQQHATDYGGAVKNLYHILTHTWHNRFRGIKIVAINELNQIITMNKTTPNKKIFIDYSMVDKRLIYQMPTDVRVVIN